jgi:hypothetical protein
MHTGRFIIVFLGFVFLLIVIFASKNIAGLMRDRFGRFLPTNVPGKNLVSPTPIPLLTPSIEKRSTSIPYETKTSTNGDEIPATGPEALAWIVISGSLSGGLILNKYSKKITWKNN